jgi:two-component system NarL family response regulator
MRIAIVEDNTLLRENLVFLLNGEKNFEVCCDYGTAEEALQDLANFHPDILLVDIGLPGMSGIDLIKKVKAKHLDMEIMVHTIFEGGAPMSPKIARAVIGEFQDVESVEQYLLTPREKEILMELEKGFTYKELAEKLSISHHTIHSHIKKIYEKLHAKSRRDALTTARKKGII